jgi:hypothetical protein
MEFVEKPKKKLKTKLKSRNLQFFVMDHAFNTFSEAFMYRHRQGLNRHDAPITHKWNKPRGTTKKDED